MPNDMQQAKYCVGQLKHLNDWIESTDDYLKIMVDEFVDRPLHSKSGTIKSLMKIRRHQSCLLREFKASIRGDFRKRLPDPQTEEEQQLEFEFDKLYERYKP